MKKTFLKYCPSCDTKKKRNERYCENCGYDFLENKVYDAVEDTRITNQMIRKYIKKEHRKDAARTVVTITAVAATVGAIVLYVVADETK